MSTPETHWIADVILQFRKYKKLGEGALAQVADDDFFRAIDPESNSIALIVKHLAGNMRSRWADFLTADGEKADRRRDEEFEARSTDSRQSLMAAWEAGWAAVFDALAPLSGDDLLREVRIRREPHTVMQAVHRQMTHYAYHVGQIVFLARHFAGPRWTSLSIPKGKSGDFDVARSGEPYRTS